MLSLSPCPTSPTLRQINTKPPTEVIRALTERVSATDLLSFASDLDLGNGSDHARAIRLGKRLEALRDGRFLEACVLRMLACARGSHRYRLRSVSEGVREGVEE
jgi:hypothetical protein